MILTSIFGFLAVAMGAFGAHGLKPHLSAYGLTIFETAVDYHMWHALALGFVAVLERNYTKDYILKRTARFFVFGIVVFSGTLYLLAVTEIKWLGAITPVGGLSFLIGWAHLFWFGLKEKKACC